MVVRHRSPFGTTLAPFARAPFVRPSFAVDRSFDQLAAALRDTRRRVPAVDAAWDEGTLTLTVDLPGVPAEAVDVEVSGRTLTIGVRTDELTWNRSMTLGTSLDPDAVSARHVDGRLTITVAPLATAAPRRIEIAGTAPAADRVSDTAIETTADTDAAPTAHDADASDTDAA